MENGKTVSKRASDSTYRKSQSADATVLVAPASRRLLALSWNFKTAGPSCVRTSKMPALPQHAVTLVQHNSQTLHISPEGFVASNSVTAVYFGRL